MTLENPVIAVVVASNREESFREWVDAWYGHDGFPWNFTILIQDDDGPKFTPRPREYRRDLAPVMRYAWEDIRRGQPDGALPEWLSRRDSGIKTWGFQLAILRHRADVVIALDDDCLPSELGAGPSRYRANPPKPPAELLDLARQDFAELHLAALARTRRWATTIPGFVPRGLPYGEPIPSVRYVPVSMPYCEPAPPGPPDGALGHLPLVLNMGLWQRIPDRDAVHELTNRNPEGYYCDWTLRRANYRHTRVMSPQQYWPLCGMNFAFCREIAPLMYFPRMGEGTAFGRFDDIWCGVIAQRCCAHLGLAMGVGGPIVAHHKASNPLDALVREAPGIRANEEFWQVIDDLALGTAEDTPLRCMRSIGVQLKSRRVMTKDSALATYLPQLGTWIGQWCNLFQGEEWERVKN